MAAAIAALVELAARTGAFVERSFLPNGEIHIAGTGGFEVKAMPSSETVLVSAKTKKSSQKLLVGERRRQILRLLDQNGRVTVEDLAKQFRVSAVTIREDLEALGTTGALIRSYGGAIRPLNPAQDYPLRFKKTLHHQEKSRIARMATQLIQPHQTLILDSGSTAIELAIQLKQNAPEALTVVTHALDIGQTLADSPNISVIVIGGVLRHISHSCVGPQAEQMIRSIHADHFFLAVDGLDLAAGLSTPDILEAQLNALMIEVSREVTVLADASKFGRRSVSAIADWSRVKRVITDSRLPQQTAEEFRQRGIEVILA